MGCAFGNEDTIIIMTCSYDGQASKQAVAVIRELCSCGLTSLKILLEG